MFRHLTSRLTAVDALTTKTRNRKVRLAVDALEDRKLFTVGMAVPTFALPPAIIHTVAATPVPSSAQTGTSLGLSWRFVPKGDAAGDGTLYIQDVKNGSDTLIPKNDQIAVNQTSSFMVIDYDASSPTGQANGPAVKSGAKVAVVVADQNGQFSGGGDVQIYDDRNAGTGGLTYLQDHESGNIQIQDDYNVSWTMDYNVITQQQVYTLNSGSYTGTLNITNEYSGADQYENNGNPNQVIGFNVYDSQGNGGAPSNVIAGATVSIVTTGKATFHNSSNF